MTAATMFTKEYWTGDSRDGAIVNGDGYHYYRMSEGGFIFLDEYFSLKFPGARIACDEFFETAPQKPEKLPQNSDFFERWGVLK